MGYDMTWIDGMTPSEEAEYHLRREAFKVAVQARDAEFPRTDDDDPPTRAVPNSEVGAFFEANPDWAVFDDEFGHPDGFTRVARKRFIELQAKVTDAFETMHEANKSYYRLNVWGMGEIRELMNEFKMLCWRHPDEAGPEWGQAPPWPAYEDYGIDPDSADVEELPPDHPFEVALRARLEWNPHPERGIEGWKLCDNSGWRVTPTEIHAALANLDMVDGATKVETFARHAQQNTDWSEADNPAVEVGRWFDRWIDWLREAEKRSGFVVY